MADKKPPAGVPAGLSRDAATKYVRSGGSHCPFCGSAQALRAEGHPVNVGAEFIYGVEQKIECLSCGKKWTDLYRLTNVAERG